MKKLFYLLLTGAFAMASCDKDDTGPVAVERVTLDKSTLTLVVGQEAVLTAAVVPDDADNRTVAWSSSDPSIATVSDAGKVKAIALGSATITASAGGGKSATCTVTVDPIAVESVTLDQTELTLKRSQNATLTATVLPDDATFPTVGWTSSDPSIATVSDAGTVTAVKPGTATITAEAGGQSAACAVTVEPDVYVTGYKNADDFLQRTGYLWKNGEATQIPINQPNSLFISGEDVYVTGNYMDETMKYTTCSMWKNGNLTLYPETNSRGVSIFVSDGNVYIAGHAGGNLAYLWTNGVMERLIPSDSPLFPTSAAYSVFVSDGDIYVAGNHVPNRDKYIRLATYWKNGEPIYLTDGTSHAQINSIVVAEGVVYAAGRENSRPVFWIDGVPTYLEGFEANSIRVSDSGDVYVAAHSPGGAPTIWKNGEQIRLSEQTGRAWSIFLYGEDVYVTGYINKQGENVAVVWKNGVPTELPEGSEALDVFVY